jgi:cytochrome c peroxidase
VPTTKGALPASGRAPAAAVLSAALSAARGGAGVRKVGASASVLVGALVLLLGIVAARLGPPARAGEPGLAVAWRPIFQRQTQPPAPQDNLMTAEKIALGARLFADRRLSRGDRSCASCHLARHAFSEPRRRALALSGRPLARNTPPLLDLAWGKRYFWDGRAASLEEQVVVPIEAPEEMDGHWPTILSRLAADSDLSALFRAAFPEEVQPSRVAVAKALACYVRSLVSPATRFDAWVAGDTAALHANERRGFGLFVGKGACVLCHVGWRFTDDRFHDVGLKSRDAGQGDLPGGTAGLVAFKTPSLRELTHTAPYMHDGSLPTLQAVVRHYSGHFLVRPSLAPQLNRRLRLSGRERDDLIAFLRTLSSDHPPAAGP